MRERPILFNGAMVRAILAGQKTQTRRVLKMPWGFDFIGGSGDDLNAPHNWGAEHEDGLWWALGAGDGIDRVLPSPLGQPGDRLWVRETWRPETIHSCAMDTCDCDSVGVSYAADGEWIPHTWQNPPPDDWYMPEAAARGNVASIHMPRWACRLVLEITDVRVERVMAISEADARAEGVEVSEWDGATRYGPYAQHELAFRDLWTSAGGEWGSNPWVWVIEFKPVEAD